MKVGAGAPGAPVEPNIIAIDASVRDVLRARSDAAGESNPRYGEFGAPLTKFKSPSRMFAIFITSKVRFVSASIA
tara:strand:- start:159 stop:383 length:225 start_codon:yes stop_codon:yes gene_type:complete